jgi:hypothetical protein
MTRGGRTSSWHAVPGNHDVDRTLAAAAPAGQLFEKFRPLTEAWADEGLAILATDAVRSTRITDGPCSVDAYGLNSCIGCGERRDVPAQFKEDLLQALKDAGSSPGEAASALDAIVAAHAEVVDAPAYAEEHINTVYDSIRASPNALAVVIAHHNLLQQAQPRFDLYTDLMNAGMARSRLGSLEVPVLYLHGHIHSDPVEYVAQLAPDKGQIICISAPEFRDGFNQVDVAFSETGAPIGCVVRRYRVRLHGGTYEEPPVRIVFRTYESSVSSLAVDIAVMLLGHPECSSLTEVQESLLQDHGELEVDQIADAIEEVEWLGLVEVLNRERRVHNWKLRVIPRHD